MVVDRLPERGKPALDLLLDRVFALPEDEADLLRGQPGGVPQEQGVPLVVREPRDEVEDVGPFALLSINFEGGLAEVGIGPGQVNRRSTATVRVDRRVPGDAEEPGLDPAVTASEPAQAREARSNVSAARSSASASLLVRARR